MVRGLGRQRPQRLLRIWVISDTTLFENYKLSSNCLKQALWLKECFPDYLLLNVLTSCRKSVTSSQRGAPVWYVKQPS